jgi:hypothetical protein
MIQFDVGLLADNAHVDGNGKLYVLGEFRYIFAASVPALHAQMAVVARWVAPTMEVKDKQHTIELEMVDQDGRGVLPRSPKIPLGFSEIGPVEYGQSQALLILQMAGLLLPKYGNFAINFIVNDVNNGSVRFHVLQAPHKA